MMEQMLWVLAIPASVFMIFVAPLWLVLAYRGRRQLDSSLSEAQRVQLRQLLLQAEQLQARVQILEKLLDQDNARGRSGS